MNSKRYFKTIFVPRNVVLLILIFFFALWNMAEWRPNQHIISEEVGGIEQNRSAVYYSQVDFVPVRAIGDNEVNGLFTFGDVLFLLFIILVYYHVPLFTGNLTDILDPLDPKEHMDFIEKTYNMKGISKLIINPYWITQELRVDDKPGSPFRRVIYAQAKLDNYEDEDGWQNMCFICNPFKKEIKSVFSIKGEMPKHLPICPNCGAHPDLKVITPEHYQELKKKFEPSR